MNEYPKGLAHSGAVLVLRYFSFSFLRQDLTLLSLALSFSHCCTEVGLERPMPLPPPLKCRNYR